MQNITNEVCLLLRGIFTVVTNLSETRIRISQKLRRINSIKLNHAFFHFTCLRVFFSTERLKIDPDVRFCWMVTFASLLPKYLGLFRQID